MSSTNGRCNSNERGSAKQRRARRRWLLSVEAGWGGDGFDVPCWDCGVLLEFEDLYVDRIIPGEDGGRYTRGNIAPHCCLCSCRQGQVRTTAIRIGRSTALVVDHDEAADVFFSRVERSVVLPGEFEMAAGEKLPGYPPYWEPALDSG